MMNVLDASSLVGNWKTLPVIQGLRSSLWLSDRSGKSSLVFPGLKGARDVVTKLGHGEGCMKAGTNILAR